MRGDMARIMVFDFDGTIIEDSIALIFARELEKISGKEKWSKFWDSQILFSKLSYDRAVEALSDILADAMRDVSVRTLDTVLSLISQDIKWGDGFTDLYDWLKSNDFKIFVISSSPEIFIKKVLTDITVDGIFGLSLEIHGNRFTGRHLGAMTNRTKASIISNRILTSKSYSFGLTDSPNDIDGFNDISVIFLLSNQQFQSNNVITVGSLNDVKRSMGQMNLAV